MKTRRTFAATCATACISDILITIILIISFKGFDWLRQPVSMLGSITSPVSSIASSWWIILGILFMICGLILMFGGLGKNAVLGGFLLLIYGLGEGIASGVFHSEHAGDYSTLEGTLHNLLSGSGVIATLVLPLVMMNIVKGRGFRIFSMIVFAVRLILFLVFQSRYIFPGFLIMDEYLGLWQGLLTVTLYIYLVVFAFRESEHQNLRPVDL